MAITDRDSLQGELELVGRPVKISWGKPSDFVRFLQKAFRVKFPVNRGNDFIVKGFQTPGSDDAKRLWARFDKNGNPLGWWSFVKSQWRPFYTMPPGGVLWINGHSKKPPPGWQVIDETVGGLNAEIVQSYMKDYVSDGADGWIKFAARYVGYGN